ncbi:retroviral-like aspartic protease family protein, partial [Acinetobacter baumannii]|nr:retroviral-like aspartic protease family protein [Acinetobacter baumannii]
MRSADEPTAPTATGTILIHGLPVKVLFDTGATHSFISDDCVARLSLATVEGRPFIVGLPDGGRVSGTRDVRGCPIWLGNRDWLAAFFVMHLVHEEVILGMDWMDRHYAILDISRRTVTISTETGHEVIFRGWDIGKAGTVISAVRAARLIGQGCEAFWCYAM